MYQVSGQADWFKGQEIIDTVLEPPAQVVITPTGGPDDYSCGSVVTVDPATDHLQVQGYEVHSTTHYLVVTTLQCSAGSALHCVHPDPSLSWPTLQHRHLTSPPLRCRWPILLM